MDVKKLVPYTAEDYNGEFAAEITFRFSKPEIEALDQLRGESCSLDEYCRRQFIDLFDLTDPEEAAKLLTHIEKEQA